MKVEQEDRGRWTPEFREWITSYRKGDCTTAEIAVLERAAGAAGDRRRAEDRAIVLEPLVLLETVEELEIMAELDPRRYRLEISPALAGTLLADELAELL